MPFLSSEELRPRSPLVIYARVSTRGQRDSLETQKQILNAEARARRVNVTGRFAEIDKASNLARPQLLRAINRAIETNAAILIHNETRLIRPNGYSPTDFDQVPTNSEWQRLWELLRGVSVFTIVNPDADYRTIRSAEIINGIRVPQTPQQLQEQWIAEWLDSELSIRQFCHINLIPKTSFLRWLKNHHGRNANVVHFGISRTAQTIKRAWNHRDFASRSGAAKH